MQKKYFSLLFLIIALIFHSCKEEEVAFELVETGYNYFPTNTGHYVIYKADSIVYNDFTGNVDTFSYELKQYIEAQFTDNSGRICQRIERYKRESDTTIWKIDKAWHSVKTETTAEMVEDNIRFIKLTFPVKKNNKWNGNAYNNSEELIYKYISVDEPYLINNLYFDSTLTVLQNDYTTIISRDYSVEVYARNTGLIYKKYINLQKEVTGVIKSGFDYTLTIKEIH